MQGQAQAFTHGFSGIPVGDLSLSGSQGSGGDEQLRHEYAIAAEQLFQKLSAQAEGCATDSGPQARAK